MNLPDPSPITSLEAAWLAGLLDGEGCFDSPRGNPRVRVKMADVDVVLRAAGLMAASTHMEYDPRPTVTGEARSPMMVAQVTGPAAVAIMRSVLPWLGSRRTAKVTGIVTTWAARQRLSLVAERRAA